MTTTNHHTQITINHNTALNGLEISFANKPTADTLAILKTNGFRWHNRKKIWYAKENEKTLAVAELLTDTTTTTKAPTPPTQAETLLPLFERVTLDETAETDNLAFAESAESVKEIAAYIRKHLKNRFPECKFSVISRGGWYSNIEITLKASPFDLASVDYDDNITIREYERLYNDANKEISAIVKYAEDYANTFVYCTHYDPYGDYGSDYNVYVTYCGIDTDYTATGITADYQVIVDQFHNDKARFETEQAEKERLEFIALEEKAEIERKEAEKRQQIRLANHNKVVAGAKLKTLQEDEQYIMENVAMARLNKNDTLQEYQDQLKTGEYYHRDIKITKELHFEDFNTYDLFANMLLSDFDFLKDSGGSYTEDERIQTLEDFYKMDKEEQETVKWNSYGIAVYHQDELMFIVDTQGYDYARYVGIVYAPTAQATA